jgi:anti-sigma factor RsiW
MTNPQPIKVNTGELKCEQVRDDLHSFLMNELDESEASAISSHLATCEECRQALREHVELFGLLRENADLLTRILGDTGDNDPPQR